MRETDADRFVTVCNVDDVPTGGGRLCVVDETMIGVFHVGDSFLALANECPHAGASLAHGDVVDETVSCRIHHWKFCLRTGRYLDEDRPQFNARTYPTRVVGSAVQVDLTTR